MKGAKFIGFFAGCGFLLSFLFGLFSHTSFLSVILKALLFAVVFGILGLLINILFEKFLAEEGSEFSSDGMGLGTTGTVSDGDIKTSDTKASSKGHFVDITIQDEDLEQSEGDNHFVVGDKHQMLTDADMRSHDSAQHSQNDNKQGFVPLKNFENLKNLSGKEAVSPDETESVDSVKAGGLEDSNDVMSIGSSNSMDTIDTLPDMNHLDFASGDDSSDDEEIDTGTDSEFVSSANTRRNGDNVPEVKDAALIAKAISSVLSNEDE